MVGLKNLSLCLGLYFIKGILPNVRSFIVSVVYMDHKIEVSRMKIGD